MTERVEALLAEIAVLPFEPPADVAFDRIRAALDAAGTPIGSNDLLIAGHVLAQGRIVATANICEFGRVAELRVENWKER